MELSLEKYNTLVSVEALASLMESTSDNNESSKDTLVVFDCRFSLADTGLGKQKYEAGHIPGSIYVHLDDELAGKVTPCTGRHPLPEVDQFTRRTKEWGITSATQVVVYDDAGGAIAGRLWWMMKWIGHNRIAVLDGGYGAWLNAGKPVSTQIEESIPDMTNGSNDFSASVNQNAIMEVSELMEQLNSGQVELYDARAASRFAGKHDPLDQVAGHIPGAVNLPFEGNLDENGYFLSSVALKHRFEKMRGADATDSSGRNIVHMCGSGVTACHNILAMEIAGIKPSRLYVGSWSEWITDATRGVETG